KGEVKSFTALLGVILRDLPDTDSGNLIVSPGSHRILEKYFQENGAECMLEGGMPPVDLPDPVQVTGNAGDIVLCHYLLAHSVASNVSPNVRYSLYFRLDHADHQKDPWQEGMLNLWKNWKSIQP